LQTESSGVRLGPSEKTVGPGREGGFGKANGGKERDNPKVSWSKGSNHFLSDIPSAIIGKRFSEKGPFSLLRQLFGGRRAFDQWGRPL